MNNQSTNLSQQLNQPFAPTIKHNWGMVMGIATMIMLIFIVFINITATSQFTVTKSTPNAPLLIYDGLIIKGSDKTLYRFKDYQLYKINTPNNWEKESAKQVSDSLLASYLQNQAFNSNGTSDSLSISYTPDFNLIDLLHLLNWGGGIFIVMGGLWLLIKRINTVNYQEYTIHSDSLKNYINQAVMYTTQIQNLLKNNSSSHQQQLLKQIATWQHTIKQIVQRIDFIQQNSLINHDLAQVPTLIATLEQQLVTETDPHLSTQLSRTLAQRKKQWRILRQLQNIITQAELQLETTVASLAAIYSQLLTNQSTAHIANYNHLSLEVDEELNCLQDYLAALKEVKMENIYH